MGRMVNARYDDVAAVSRGGVAAMVFEGISVQLGFCAANIILRLLRGEGASAGEGASQAARFFSKWLLLVSIEPLSRVAGALRAAGRASRREAHPAVVREGVSVIAPEWTKDFRHVGANHVRRPKLQNHTLTRHPRHGGTPKAAVITGTPVQVSPESHVGGALDADQRVSRAPRDDPGTSDIKDLTLILALKPLRPPHAATRLCINSNCDRPLPTAILGIRYFPSFLSFIFARAHL
ncbi:hypothetical protein MRX96_030866 [Rhipicephalus microplus]